MSNYLTIPYGAGYLYGSNGGIDSPTDLRFYRTNIDGIYVFHWGFDQAFISPTLTNLDFELQLATDPDFTLNLTSFLKADVVTYQNGDVRKGYAVPVNPRIDKQDQLWYARVRSKIGVSTSDWSPTLVFAVLEKFELEETENLMLNLPDEHVYGKEDLKKPVASRNTNLYTILNMYGREFDKAKLENILTSTNRLIDLCRDENLYDNFGYFFNYIKPPSQEFVEYREAIRALVLASLEGSTVNAILRVVRSFTGVNPVLNLVRDRKDLFLSTVTEVPVELPDGVRTHFSTSSNYAVRSLTVYKNGIVQYIDTHYTEDHVAYGFNMIVPPAPGDTLTVFFDIGLETDPVLIVFDTLQAVLLTGNFIFTNGSTAVTGSGTAFTAELAPGQLITDQLGGVLAEIESITSNTSLTLKHIWTGSTSAPVVSGYRIQPNSTRPLFGDITFTNGSTSITGTGTSFISELRAGSMLTDELGSVIGIVQNIIDNVSLTLRDNWTGTTHTTSDARVAVYDDTVVWATSTLAYGLIITVRNPGQFVLETDLIELLVKKILPAHILVYFEYE